MTKRTTIDTLRVDDLKKMLADPRRKGLWTDVARRLIPELETLRAEDSISTGTIEALESDLLTAKAENERLLTIIEIDKLKVAMCDCRHYAAENERLSNEIRGLERFRDLRTRHGDEMQRRTTQLANATAEIERVAEQHARALECIGKQSRRAEAWKKAAEAWVFVADTSKLIFARGDGSPSDLALDAIEAARALEQEGATVKESLTVQSGKHLGAVRSWMKWHCRNGDRVTWGSDQVLEREFTVRDLEEIAQKVADAVKEGGEHE